MTFLVFDLSPLTMCINQRINQRWNR